MQSDIIESRTCQRCHGTVLPPSRSGAFRGTCSCPRAAHIRGRASLSTDTNPGTSYVYEVSAARRGVEPFRTESLALAVARRDHENALAIEWPDRTALLEDGYAVRFRGQIESARWTSEGAAAAHLDLLQSGASKPAPEQCAPSPFVASLMDGEFHE